jgi:hypothetical protein
VCSKKRPKTDKVLKRAQFHIRKQRFCESCAADPRAALVYLKEAVHPVVDFENADEVKEFHDLAFWLFRWNEKEGGESLKYRGFLVGGEESGVFSARSKLFEQLLCFFPEGMKEPSGNLVDLLVL